MKPVSISKTLSANDTGETGGHQAGMLIPKVGEVLEFFPELEKNKKNPRMTLVFEDDSLRRWNFNYIYYNNVFFGGTRNEYRLTGMTAFIRQNNLKVGDSIVLTRKPDGSLTIRFQRKICSEEQVPKLKVTGTWKVIKY